MKKVVLLAAAALMSLLSITVVNAGSTTVPAIQNDQILDQNEQIISPKVGISWREQVMKERAIMRRAAEMRNANMRNALMGKKDQIEGITIDDYNDLILERNANFLK
jgi:hypothetical protein